MADALACYWDTSAILSLLVEDAHTKAARAIARRPGVHLVSSLAYAETAAVLDRLARQGILSSEVAGSLLAALDHGPWRHSPAVPARKVIREVRGRHALRGADLWHLALVLTLSREHHPFALACFDRQLVEAAAAEGIT
jgi:predicted nucleic acid-binding protein